MINKSTMNRPKAIILITLGIALGLGCLNWPRRDLRVSTDPKWLQVTEFIRSADEVKTFATKADLESEAQLTKAVKQRNGVLRTVADRKPLLDHLAILPSIPGSESPPAACFCPHHFVFAKKGKATLRLDICYGCGSCGVRSTDKNLAGGFPIKSDARVDSGALFGLQAGGHAEGFGCRYFAD
jgi:hypothetical protein